VAAVPAAVYVAVSVPESGRVKHLARGDLISDRLPNEQRTWRTFSVAPVFPASIDNIEGELWLKLLRIAH